MEKKSKAGSQASATKIKAYEDVARQTESAAEPAEEAASQPSDTPPSDASPDTPAGDTPTEGEELTEQLAAAKEEAKTNYDRFLRAKADVDNIRKRCDRELSDFRKYANETILKELLPVVDTLERAMVSEAGDDPIAQSILEGVDLTLKELVRVMERFSVKPVTAVGKQFDPAFHQAISRVETDDHPEGTVVEEYQKGYLLHDRLLRPAMVVVATPVAS